MKTIKPATTTVTRLTPSSTCRNGFSWIVLAAVLLIWSVPAQAQSVQYADASKIIAETPQVDQVEEAVLPLHHGMPALKKRMPKIFYPLLAERFQIEGRVLVEYVVNEKGRVIKSKVRKSVGYGCDRAALLALRRARFHPVLDAAGQPQQARYLAAFQFKLED